MIALIGSGGMAREYAIVLKEQKQQFVVVGRGAESALTFEKAIGVPVIQGGLDAALSYGNIRVPSSAIVSVGVESLFSTTARLLTAGVKRILVEKPAGLNAEEIRALDALARTSGAAVFVAYNRRFYSSVRAARKMIAADGGVQSFSFEFTEWGHEIETLTKAPGVKGQWVLANSSHVIDLAFFLGGVPEELCAFRAGSLPWHPSAAVFSGAGRTTSGALFSYQANWGAPGRWGVEICTCNYRFIFRPMEALQIMRKASIVIEPQPIEDAEIDKNFKPGFFLQTKAFLGYENSDALCLISDHATMLPFYTKIAGYK